MTKCILNDRIINLDQAQIHVSDLALLRAYGIFDFFRLVGLQPLFIDDHIERFFASADHLRLPCPIGRQHLQDLIMQLIGINQIPNSGIRLVLTGGESDTGYSIGTPTLFVLNEPINPLPQQHFAQGIKLLSYEYQRDIPEVKTINYLVGIYKLPEVKEKGATDMIYHWNGKVSELTRSNFFIVDQNGVIATAGNGVLKGINRKHVIDLAGRHFEVQEREVFIDELHNATEAFITGTTKKVTPVVQVDDIVIGDGQPGPVTMKLQQLYDSYIMEHLRQRNYSV